MTSAIEFLDQLGVERICVFERRKRRLEPIGRTGVDRRRSRTRRLG